MARAGHSSSVVEDRVMERWFAFEMSAFHRGFVSPPRPLSELVLEERPTARTRGGDEIAFDPAMLRRFHDALSPLDRRRLRLPVTIQVDKDYSSDASLADEVAHRLLLALGEIPGDLDMREGKLWISHAQAQALRAKYSPAFQLLYV